MDGEAEFELKRGRIDRLEVENFKSYRGHQRIGPFKDFTAVIGPNGSGKSNLMDAISFVLGIRTAQLRGSLKELLYSDGGVSAAEQPRSAYVKLVYGADEEGGDADGAGRSSARELHFSRVIVPTSASDPDSTYKSEYRIDDRTVSFEAYCARLGGLGIHLKGRNFLIFQGDIENVAARTPLGLTELFEAVSGSDALRKRFDELAKAKAEAEEKVALLFARRKQVQAELKAKKREKEDAERHAKGVEELRGYKSDLAVWQLVMEGRGLAEAMADQRQAEEKLAALQNKAGDHEGKVEALRRQAAGFKKDAALLDKKIKKLQADKEKKSPSLLKSKEELSRVGRAIKLGVKALDDKRAAVGGAEDKIAKLRAELKTVDKEIAALEKEVSSHYAAHAKKGSEIDSGAMRDEYNALKARARAETTKLATDRDTLQAQQESAREQLKQLTAAMEQLRGRASQLEEQAEREEARSGVAPAELEGLKRTLSSKQEARQRLQQERTRTNSQRTSLEAKRDKLQQELESLKMDRNQSRRERDMADMTDRLKKRFQGAVYGKLVTLAKPIQIKYQLAMSVAMQRDLDSVVVSDEAVAKQCIQVLNEEKKPQMNFLPLDFLKVKPAPERLRQLGPGAKLALDLLDIPDRRLERAFQYALGDTVICDDEDAARSLAFGAQRLKVVTLQGTLITKRGTMTGGSAPAEARGARWDEGEVTRLRAELEEVHVRLGELRSGRQLDEEEAALVGEINSLGSRIRYMEADAKESTDKVRKLREQAARAQEDAAKREPEAARLRKAMEAREAQIQRLKSEIDAATDRIMADFSRRAGLKSVREYEERHLAFEERTDGRRRELRSRHDQIESQLQYETSRTDKLRKAAEEAEAELEAQRRRQAELEEAVAGGQEAAGALDGQIKELTKQAAELQDKAKAVEGEVAELHAAASELARRSSALKGAAAKAAAAVEERATRMLEMVNAARLEQVKLPRRRSRAGAGDDGDEEEDEDGDASMADGEGPSYVDLDELVAGLAIGGDEAGGDGGTAAAAQQAAATAAAMTRLMGLLDTSRLTKSQLAATTAREREAARSELEGRISTLAAELDRAAPNMRALEQYEAVRAREKAQNEALKAAQAESAAATEEFNRVRTQRHDLFTTAFKHVAEQISAIYKDLTRSSTHPLGGQAYLHLENEDEPYAGGIKYTAIPPAKRFRDMEQLSGGEKTVAALALLFAVHSFRPSPFFVLDEVDAALDATNVARVAHYIRRRTRRGQPGGGGGAEGAYELPAAGSEAAEELGSLTGFQSIVISLKDIFYEKADSLVGVCRDLDRNCSQTFTFDLSRFAEPQPDA
ncbi:hypothetical protein GPECTOR_67g310 [Gonium pectorale]|uniref:Structural maintenance of chromosomes protein n=1 Tax=Gonium pectorale TaxID=33097 RepID=A0A150G577_GONPE|nr:hypothetical protein GPECTOR_67g310 [Gonium pectorale]|eukprot:KXZ44470.1 hypothetical protein GPECTOR_67g310 [Gonium pectorale]